MIFCGGFLRKPSVEIVAVFLRNRDYKNHWRLITKTACRNRGGFLKKP
jgi:hypothetical protein